MSAEIHEAANTSGICDLVLRGCQDASIRYLLEQKALLAFGDVAAVAAKLCLFAGSRLQKDCPLY